MHKMNENVFYFIKKSKEHKKRMDDLPNEILYKICKYLSNDITDSINLSKVNYKLYKTINSNHFEKLFWFNNPIKFYPFHHYKKCDEINIVFEQKAISTRHRYRDAICICYRSNTF